MSDYEMADSFSSMFSGLQMLFTSYVSIIFCLSYSKLAGRS